MPDRDQILHTHSWAAHCIYVLIAALGGCVISMACCTRPALPAVERVTVGDLPYEAILCAGTARQWASAGHGVSKTPVDVARALSQAAGWPAQRSTPSMRADGPRARRATGHRVEMPLRGTLRPGRSPPVRQARSCRAMVEEPPPGEASGAGIDRSLGGMEVGSDSSRPSDELLSRGRSSATMMISVSERRRRWVQAALDRVVKSVATATEGHRNDTLFLGACQLAELPSEPFDAGQIFEILLSAAAQPGLSQRDARSTIGSGISHGRRNPKPWPDGLRDDTAQRASGRTSSAGRGSPPAAATDRKPIAMAAVHQIWGAAQSVNRTRCAPPAEDIALAFALADGGAFAPTVAELNLLRTLPALPAPAPQRPDPGPVVLAKGFSPRGEWRALQAWTPVLLGRAGPGELRPTTGWGSAHSLLANAGGERVLRGDAQGVEGVLLVGSLLPWLELSCRAAREGRAVAVVAAPAQEQILAAACWPADILLFLADPDPTRQEALRWALPGRKLLALGGGR